MLITEKNTEPFSITNKNEKTEPIKAQDFLFTQSNGIGILRINSSLETFSNASIFKSFCDSIFKNNLNLVIDFSRCKILGSAFFGAIVLSRKNSQNNNLLIKLVINDYMHVNYYQRKPMAELFEVFDNLNDAIQSYQI